MALTVALTLEYTFLIHVSAIGGRSTLPNRRLNAYAGAERGKPIMAKLMIKKRQLRRKIAVSRRILKKQVAAQNRRIRRLERQYRTVCRAIAA